MRPILPKRASQLDSPVANSWSCFFHRLDGIHHNKALLLDVNNGFWLKDFDRELIRWSLLISFNMEITCVLPLCPANQYRHKWWKSFLGKTVTLVVLFWCLSYMIRMLIACYYKL